MAAMKSLRWSEDGLQGCQHVAWDFQVTGCILALIFLLNLSALLALGVKFVKI